MATELNDFHKRAVMYAKDIQKVMGHSERSARRMLKKIIEKFGRRNGNFVTVQEFSHHTHIPESTIYKYLDY